MRAAVERKLPSADGMGEDHEMWDVGVRHCGMARRRLERSIEKWAGLADRYSRYEGRVCIRFAGKVACRATTVQVRTVKLATIGDVMWLPERIGMIKGQRGPERYDEWRSEVR